MDQKRIIIFIVALFLLSSVYLFYSSGKAIDPDYQKDFWSVYFTNPKINDFNFTIENHSNNTNFHWEAYDGKIKTTEGDAIIKKGETRKLDVNSKIGSIHDKLTIRVLTGKEEREIYKNFK